MVDVAKVLDSHLGEGKFILEQATKAERRKRIIALLFL
jgi:hypothetical protein